MCLLHLHSSWMKHANQLITWESTVSSTDGSETNMAKAKRLMLRFKTSGRIHSGYVHDFIILFLLNLKFTQSNYSDW